MKNKEQEKEQTRDLIQLLDGTVLKCYRKDSVQKTLLDDEMNLDATGTFFRLKDKRSAKKIEVDTRSMLNRKEDEDLQFFLDHAFLFYRNAETILKDSRMFLAPVPVHSGLAYSGGSGFASPTLGVYIEWWLRNEQLVCRDLAGNEALTYLILGSPLSGSNRCRCVYPDGTSEQIVFNKFIEVWSSFAPINSRYNQAKQLYQAYTLQEVADVLASRQLPDAVRLSKEIEWHENRCQSAQQHLEQQKDKTRQLEENYRAVNLRLCEFLVAPLVDEYRVRRDAYMASEEQFQLDKSSCRVLFETGELSSDEYQRMLTPFTKKRKEGRKSFVDYMNQQVARISSEEHIPISIIWEWLESKGCPRVQK